MTAKPVLAIIASHLILAASLVSWATAVHNRHPRVSTREDIAACRHHKHSTNCSMLGRECLKLVVA
jgi:hypothetical protein